ASRLGHAAVIAVIADDERNLTSGLLRQGRRVVAAKVPALKACRQIRGAFEHAVALVGTRYRQTDSTHIVPRETVVGEEAIDSVNPTLHDRCSPGLGIRRTLPKLGRDGGAVGPDAAGFGGGRAAVGADVNALVSAHEGMNKEGESVRLNDRAVVVNAD